MLDDLEHNGWPVSDEDFALAVRARALPIEVLTAADARVSDLEARKKHFAEELSEQQQAFIGTMRKLADAADEFRSHLDVEEAEENHTMSNKLLQDLKNAKADGEVINRREGLFGWHITSHEMLSEVEAEITPYSELWEVAVDMRQFLPAWYDGPFKEVEPSAVSEKAKHWLNALSNQLEHFESNEDEEAYEACVATREKLVDLESHLPVVSTLRAPGMRERHWEMLNARTGLSLQFGDTSLTLTKLIETGIAEFTDEMEEVGALAAAEYAVERLLERMASEWRVFEIPLDPHHESDTHVRQQQQHSSSSSSTAAALPSHSHHPSLPLHTTGTGRV